MGWGIQSIWHSDFRSLRWTIAIVCECNYLSIYYYKGVLSSFLCCHVSAMSESQTSWCRHVSWKHKTQHFVEPSAGLFCFHGLWNCLINGLMCLIPFTLSATMKSLECSLLQIIFFSHSFSILFTVIWITRRCCSPAWSLVSVPSLSRLGWCGSGRPEMSNLVGNSCGLICSWWM